MTNRIQNLKIFQYFMMMMIFSPFTMGATAPVFNGTQLSGITGLVVGTNSYNVSFVEGSFTGLFVDSSGLFFTNSADAFAASDVLASTLDMFYPSGHTPSVISGIEGTQANIITPYSLSQTLVNTIFTHFPSGFFASHTSSGSYGLTTDTLSQSGAVYANWTQVSNVPIPPAAWLMGSGFLAVMGLARKKKALVSV